MNNTSHTIFGTDGIRKTVGTPPLSHHDLPNLGRAIGQWAQKKYGPCPTILIAHDTRNSCAYIKTALSSGLLLSPIMLYDTHVLPTPAAHLLAKNNRLINCSIIISASHNPYQDNGIKIIDANKSKISADDEACISRLFNENNDTPLDYSSCGSMQWLPAAAQNYSDMLINLFPPSLLNGKKIVIDCAHGATYHVAPKIFKALGAELIVINNEPNGKNINDHNGAVYPEQLQKIVLENNAHAGFAFDGDGDRIAVISKSGEIKDGDDIMAMLLAGSLYSSVQMIVGTLMSNKGFESFLNKQNKNIVRTAVGDKYVLAKMMEQNIVLGGEPSGHIIMRDYLDISDGIFTALRLAQILNETDNWHMHSFTKYPQILLNRPITVKKDLTDPIIQEIIASHEQRLKAGRIIVRYSGTENMLRVMVEDETKEQASHLANQLADLLQKQLS